MLLLQGLCLQISASAYMASMAYSSSVNTRIGNELGAGNAATARLAFIIGVAAVILVQACMILGLFFGARQVLALLTNNEEVEGLARQVFPILLPTFIGKAGRGEVVGWLGAAAACCCVLTDADEPSHAHLGHLSGMQYVA